MTNRYQRHKLSQSLFTLCSQRDGSSSGRARETGRGRANFSSRCNRIPRFSGLVLEFCSGSSCHSDYCKERISSLESVTDNVFKLLVGLPMSTVEEPPATLEHFRTVPVAVHIVVAVYGRKLTAHMNREGISSVSIVFT